MKITDLWKLNFNFRRKGDEIITDTPHVITLTGFSTMTPEIKQEFLIRINGLYVEAKKARAADDVIKGRLHERLAKAKIREYKIAKRMYGEENYRLHARANLQAKWAAELEVFKVDINRFPENHYAQEHYFKRLELRSKARATYLAYGYLKNVGYSIIENLPRWKREELVNPHQYSPNWELMRDIVWEQSNETQDRLFRKHNDLAEARNSLLKEIYEWSGFVPKEKEEKNPGEGGGNEKKEEKTSEQAA